jgi:hypothetical protein
MPHFAYELSAIVDLDGNVFEYETVSQDVCCSEECRTIHYNTLMLDGWCQHPTSPDLLIGARNDYTPTHVFVVEFSEGELYADVPWRIDCSICNVNIHEGTEVI